MIINFFMNKRKAVVIFFIIIASLQFTACSKTVLEISSESLKTVEQVQEIDVTFRIINGDDVVEKKDSLEVGSNLLDHMKKMQDNGDFSLVYKESNLGVFIESINEVENASQKNYYWILYINNELSLVGASDYLLVDNDLIEWKFIDTSNMFK